MDNSRKLADRISELAMEKKGEDITIMEMSGLTNTCDYFVLITGSTDIHNRTIADFIERELRNEGLHVYHKEGYDNANWILLDYVDVVVHIFKPEVREYYDLESLWADAKVYLIRDEA